MHLIMCAWTKMKEALADRDLVYKTLQELVSLLKMNAIFPPYVFDYHGVKEDEWGVSGICIIAESHLSIHTWPVYDQLQIDCYSCKDFDVRALLTYLIDRFSIDKIDGVVYDRGVGRELGQPRQITEFLSSKPQGTSIN